MMTYIIIFFMIGIEMDRQLQEKEALLKAERELKMAELQQLENLRKKEEEEAIKASKPFF